MIETLEQYNAYKNDEDMVVNVSKHGRIIANSRNEAIETIEALRNVARATRELDISGMILSLPGVMTTSDTVTPNLYPNLREALDALPAWVLEDGDAG